MKTEPLNTIADVITGVPLSRLQKDSAKGEAAEVNVLMPQAITSYGVDISRTKTSLVHGAGQQFFTQEGDVVLKVSPPYDCAYINGAVAGLLVTSTCLILRPRKDAKTYGRYLAAYFSGSRGMQELLAMSKGTAVKTIKKKDLEATSVPSLSPEERQQLADTHKKVRAIKALCREFESKSETLLASELDRLLQNNDN